MKNGQLAEGSQDLQVLYEDNHLIAVFKPAGVLVQADTTGGASGAVCLMDMVKDFIKNRDNKPGNVFLGLIHRLDRNVSGIVLFAKTSKGASRLSEQFRDHTVEKIYHARVEGVPKQKSTTLKNYLLHREGGNKAEVLSREVPGAQYAELSYETVAVEKSGSGDVALLKIKLGTGRHHQIRAQLGAIGHPILGDVKYGAHEVFKDQHLALYATELSFNLATTVIEKGNEEIAKGAAASVGIPARKTITIPVPAEM
jgi:23S rRNA pseudouridine1911/1915/1917 synthase